MAKKELRTCYYCFFVAKTAQALGEHEKACTMNKRKREVVSARGNMKEFVSCIFTTKMGRQCDPDGGPSVRHIEKGELLEVLQGPMVEQGSRVARVRARCVRDSATGWVTTKSNKGWFLRAALQPYLMCPTFSMLYDSHEGSPEMLREVMPDEVLELIEGPREGVDPMFCVKIRAVQDGVVGWIWLSDETTDVWRRPNSLISRYPGLLGLVTDSVE